MNDQLRKFESVVRASPAVQARLYEIAKQVTSDAGFPYTDPRTGEMFHPKGVDGAMMWEDSWWAPKFGCDTLDNLLDAIEHIVNRRVKIASWVAKMYFTIASNAIGEEQVRKDRDAYMAKRGM